MTMQFAKPILAFVLSATGALAFAGPSEPYTQKRFDELAAQGKPALVAVHADWCPTCKAQKPILGELMGRPEFRDVTELVVDFDAQKPIVQKFKVGMQSTLIAFKGGKEVGRSVGDTTRSGIEGLVKKAAN
jgi:thioredoxin 1